MDLTDSPDLFPVLAALAAFSKKPCTLVGAHRLAHKESNRAEVLIAEFAKAGVRIEHDDVKDALVIHPVGKAGVQPARLQTHGDHRIAMAAALLGLAGAPIEVAGAECVAKSYPAFFDDLEVLGAQIDWVSKDRGG